MRGKKRSHINTIEKSISNVLIAGDFSACRMFAINPWNVLYWKWDRYDSVSEESMCKADIPQLMRLHSTKMYWNVRPIQCDPKTALIENYMENRSLRQIVSELTNISLPQNCDFNAISKQFVSNGFGRTFKYILFDTITSILRAVRAHLMMYFRFKLFFSFVRTKL